ncbi:MULTISPECIES: IS110 family transposase [Catenuloplanes]|uniref:Transposase n=1 Tax=Catenuloplanes niger TaxID=587534 RepID=A0AAE3ZRK1_9ACTN|nr:transposase [Catenuloplanes niger]MDR7322560.1 transposase [Catenuloplanes niger]
MSRISHPPAISQTGARTEAVLGVDTHKDFHAAAVVSAAGMLLGSRTSAATADGYQQMLDWAASLGQVRSAGIEGTHSYGAALTRHLHAVNIQIIEVNQPDKADRRRRGKTDAIDAETAARAVLSGRATATAKTGDGPVEMIRLFKLAKASAIKSRSQTINQLKPSSSAQTPNSAHPWPA